MGLFGGVVPKTVENFRALCTGEKGKGKVSNMTLHYKGTKFHKVIPGLQAEGGDVVWNDGRGGESIYGKDFKNENYNISHDRKHLLSMIP